jgi:hypothetical protein
MTLYEIESRGESEIEGTASPPARIAKDGGVAHLATMLASLLLLAMIGWAPPSREMPPMPAAADLNGGWRNSVGNWLSGLGVDIAELRATGEGGGTRLAFVRFSAGVRTVATWSDRNRDGRADMIETYRDGAASGQLIDSDYDGRANLLRSFDSSGALSREQRYP